MTPVKFTFTSHVVVTLGLAFVAFAYVISVALRQHGWGFFGTFLPHGTPLWLAPLIVVIEVISYLARPITLGVRLFANVLAGHMIIKLFGDFSAMMMETLGAGALALVVFPVVLMVVFFAFEVIVVLIQSYIFILLTSVYLRSSLEGH
jgi:F-type H+-transporting ATPase subunit a